MKPRKTTEKFKEEFYNLVGDEYEVLGEYKHNKEKIKIKHNLCSKVFEATPNNLLHKSRPTGCSFCYGNKKKTTNEFKNKIFNLVQDEYEVLGEYKTTHDLIQFKHKTCGSIFDMRPSNFLQGQRCPECNLNKLKTHQEFLNEVKKLEKKNYIVLENYVNDSTKINFYHKKCGTTYSVTPRDFLNGHRCPTCKSRSRGELRIRDYLIKNNINFKSQFYFDDLRSPKKRLLKFDFAILDKKDKVKYLIEFDGSQHYYSFGDPDEFDRIQSYDLLKNTYCDKNDINLIRISFKEENNIETILGKIKI
jgi:predicted Zn-ribbon and HTH transcriptional regulator